jgi:hypothetical protein
VVAFILGLGSYLGSLAIMDVPGAQHTRNRDIFIVYCVTAFFSFSLYVQSSLVQWSQKVSDQVDKIMVDLYERRQNILRTLNLQSNTDYLEWVSAKPHYPMIPTSTGQQSSSTNKNAAASQPPSISPIRTLSNFRRNSGYSSGPVISLTASRYGV